MIEFIKYVWEQFVMVCTLTMGFGMIWFLIAINKTLLEKTYVEYPSLVMLTIIGYASCFVAGYISGKKQRK